MENKKLIEAVEDLTRVLRYILSQFYDITEEDPRGFGYIRVWNYPQDTPEENYQETEEDNIEIGD